jgi:hypothetical protein
VCNHARKKGTYEEGIDKGISDHNKLVPIEGGEGFNPRPVTLPEIAASLTFSGAIQVIQLKYDIAWMM